MVEDNPQLLRTLQRLLDAPAADLEAAMTYAANALADALGSDKVDAFLYDDTRDSLVAVGTSTQPLSMLQQRLGLDVLPVSNGGRVVSVYQTGEVFRSGDLLNDPDELRGVKEGLKIASQIGVPLEVAGQRRGMVMIASLQPDYFTPEDEAFARTAVRWVGTVAHRAELIGDIERNAVEQGRRASAEELVTVLAHDLRNYLSPVVSRLYALRHRAAAADRAEDAELIDGALAGTSKISSLISDLLDVARIDRGLFALDPEPIDLVAICKEIAEGLSTPDHEILVNASDAIVAWADLRRMRQCLQNVLANAISYSPRAAPVSVFIAEVNADDRLWATVEIKDEGPGIPDEMLPYIFEPFHSARREEGGLGLGLHLAKQIAVAHGGELSVESDAGEGSRFVIKLPRYGEGAPSEA